MGTVRDPPSPAGRMSQPSDWPAVQRPLPVTIHRTHNAEQGSLAAKIWGIECSLWERGAVGPSEKGARQMWSLPERRPRRRSIG